MEGAYLIPFMLFYMTCELTAGRFLLASYPLILFPVTCEYEIQSGLFSLEIVVKFSAKSTIVEWERFM